MLMADPAACLAEVLRVLRPGGRLAAVVWGPPEDNPWPAVVLGVLIEEGAAAGGAGQRPGLFALADEARLRDLVAGAGLAGVVVDRIPANWQYADADEYWRVQTTLSTAAARTLAPLDDDRLAGIRRRVDERLAPFRTADGLVLPASASASPPTGRCKLTRHADPPPSRPWRLRAPVLLPGDRCAPGAWRRSSSTTPEGQRRAWSARLHRHPPGRTGVCSGDGHGRAQCGDRDRGADPARRRPPDPDRDGGGLQPQLALGDLVIALSAVPADGQRCATRGRRTRPPRTSG